MTSSRMRCEKVATAPLRRLLVRSMVEKGMSERRAPTIVRMSATALRNDQYPVTSAPTLFSGFRPSIHSGFSSCKTCEVF